MRSEKEMIDYDDNIQSHEQFVELLIKLRKLTKYIEIIQLDRENKKEPLILMAQEKMILLEKCKAKSWHGTECTAASGVVYEFDVADKSFFETLMEYDAFYYPDEVLDGRKKSGITDFGTDDIAFLDSDHRPLFYATPHERVSMIHPDVLDVDISWLKKKVYRKDY